MYYSMSCSCKCKLNTSLCNNKQCLNNDKCKCEWKKLIGKGRCDDGLILESWYMWMWA